MELGLGQKSPSNADLIKDATTQSFMADVIQASQDVLVLADFWAPWCGPCRQLTPTIEKVVRSYSGKVRLVKVNVDENQAIAGQLKIQSVPTVYAFRGGRPVDGFTGAQPEGAIRKLIDRLLAEDVDDGIGDVLATADELLEQGDLHGAVEVYAAILQEDQGNADALAGLAQCYLKSKDIERARQTLDLVPPDKRNGARQQSVAAAIALAEKTPVIADFSALEAKVGDNPGDHQARFDLALALAAEGRKADAVDHLLKIFAADRTWNDDGARKQVLEFFEAWGPKDPAVVDGRRRLSTLLFR